MALQEVKLALSATDIPWLRDLTLHEAFGARGGLFVDLTRTKEADGVVVRCWGDPSCQRALKAGKAPLSLYWFWDCVRFSNFWRADSDLLYKPWPSGGIAGASGVNVTVTGIQGPMRLVVLDLLQSIGVGVQKDMHLPSITHIIAKQVDDNSQKLVQARRPEFCAHISIVNIIWLLDSIRRRQIQPAEPYLGNVPAENDPCRDAPASWAKMPGVQEDVPDPAVPDSPQHEGLQGDQAEGDLAGPGAGAADAQLPGAQQAQPGSGPSDMPAWMGQPSAAAASSRPYHTPASPRLIPAHQQAGQISAPTRAQPAAGPAVAVHCDLEPAVEDGVEDADAESEPETEPEPEYALSEPGGPAGSPPGQLPGPPIPSASTHTGSTHASSQDNSQQGPEQPHSCSAPQPPPGAHSNPNPTPEAVPAGAAKAPAQPLAPSSAQRIRLRRVRSTGGAPAAAAGALTGPAGPPEGPPAKRTRRSAPGASIPLAQGRLVVPPGPEADEPAGPAPGDQQPAHAEAAAEAAEAAEGGAPKQPRRRSAAQAGQDSRRSSSRLSAGAANLQKVSKAPAAAAAAPGAVGRRRASKGQAEPADSEAAGEADASEPHGASPRADEAEQPQQQRRGQQPARRRSGKENVRASAAHGARGGAAEPLAGKGRGSTKQAKAAPKAKGKAARRQDPLTPGLSKTPGVSKTTAKRKSLRTPATAGPRKTPGRDALGLSRTLISLSKMHTDERGRCLEILRSLQLPVSHAPMWEPNVTHVVAPCLARNARILAAMAAGLWVVSWDLLDVSQRSRCLVEPEPFELLEDASGAMAPGVARHWRLRAEQSSCGAFHGLQVVLLPDCAGPGGHPTRDELAAMVLAGGGCVVPPAQAGQPGAADVAIVSAQAAATASCIRPLLQAQVPCAGPQLLIQWLSQPTEDLTSHLCCGTSLTGHLAAAAEARSRLTMD